jgi:auxin efflux carrier family protein
MKMLTSAIGDIPLAFVMTLTATSPFTPQDQAIGVAYISIIIVWCFLTMFPFGGWILVKRDFETQPIREDIEAQGRMSSVRWLSRVKGIAMRCGAPARVACTNNRVEEYIAEDKDSKIQPRDLKITAHTSQVKNSRLSTSSSSIGNLDIIRPVQSHTSEVFGHTELQDPSPAETRSFSRSRSLTTPIPMDPLENRMGRRVLKFFLSLISPPAIACLLSLSIALVPQVKALFVADVQGVNMPNAPDGMPPLEWVLDIANFGGNSLQYFG